MFLHCCDGLGIKFKDYIISQPANSKGDKTWNRVFKDEYIIPTKILAIYLKTWRNIITEIIKDYLIGKTLGMYIQSDLTIRFILSGVRHDNLDIDIRLDKINFK